MKKIAVLFILTAMSCGIPYDGETIIDLKLKVVNSSNVPLENQKAFISAYVGNDASDSSTYKTESSSDGLIQFTMFKPNNSSSLFLEESLEYLPVYLNGVNDDNFEGLNWDLGTLTLLKLDEISSFIITPNRVSFNKIILKIDLEAIKYEEKISFYSENYLYNQPQLFFQLKKNQNFELNYQIRNTVTEQIENFSIPLAIANQDINYILTY